MRNHLGRKPAFGWRMGRLSAANEEQVVLMKPKGVGGGLTGLQTASIVAAFPFMLIMVAMCVSLVKLLNSEREK